MRYWLFKSEPGCFSIDDLAASPKRTAPWDGVRNFQARNFLRDEVAQGDPVFFYHSVTDPGIVGLMTVTGGPRPDPTQWDPESEHPDLSSPADNPRWFLVDVTLKEIFARPLPLKMLRSLPELSGMELLKRGSRLSIQPVSAPHFALLMDLAANAGKRRA
ncbi:MAG: EVE domain-containing protein [Deltaproteobacteria bacterium]|jgi:predicted RNA-binding protein with PUA-like domain|nr:EVE domain-containing protein [Deltaproteobacteria bacterium]